MLSKFPFGNSSFGIPQVGEGIPTTFGTYYFVDYDNGSDDYEGSSMDQALKKVATAYGLATTNKNDVLCLSANSSHALTGMLTVAKNRLTIVGLDGGGRVSGQGAKITLGVTTDTDDVAVLKVTGTRNNFHNLKVINTNTLTQSLYAAIFRGEANKYVNCSFQHNAHLADATAADVLCAEDSGNFFGCEFGNDAVVTSVARPTMLIDALDGQRMKHCRFYDCSFTGASSNANRVHIKVADTAAIAFANRWYRCSFDVALVGSASAAAITNAVASASGLIEGTLIFYDCPSANCTNFCAGVTDQVIVTKSASSNNAGEGVTPA